MNNLTFYLDSLKDYPPFGMPMPGRSLSLSNYKFGFNGKENDNEVKGNGNWQDYGMRYYDPRLARFPNVDPITESYPALTPFQFASNCPIKFIDIDGLEAGEPGYNAFRASLAIQNATALKVERDALTNVGPPIFETAGEIVQGALDGGSRIALSLAFGLTSGYYFAATEKKLKSFVFGFSWQKGVYHIPDPESDLNTKILLKATISALIPELKLTKQPLINKVGNVAIGVTAESVLDKFIITKEDNSSSSSSTTNSPTSPVTPPENPHSNNNSGKDREESPKNNDENTNRGGSDNAYDYKGDDYTNDAELYPR